MFFDTGKKSVLVRARKFNTKDIVILLKSALCQLYKTTSIVKPGISRHKPFIEHAFTEMTLIIIL